MEKLLMCRICLTTDIHSASTLKSHLQDTYEKLTVKQFETKDIRPILACYLCRARLQNCYQLSMNCLQSEELLTQILSGNMLNPGNLQNITRTIRLGITPVIVETFGDSHLFDLDASGKPTSEFEGVDIEMKVVVNQVLEENVPEEKIKEEPVVEDAFQYEYVKSEDIPLDIVKHEISTVSSVDCSTALVENAYDRTIQTDSRTPLLAVKTEYEVDAAFSSQSNEENRIIKSSDDLCVEITKEELNEITTNTSVTKNEVFKVTAAVNCQSKETSTSNISLDKSINNSLHTNFVCKTCHECFNCKNDLEKHICTDNNKKVYKCAVCKKCFSQKYTLTVHIRTHTGEKPYQCNDCKKCFSGNSSFISHCRTHTGEKPFQCDICKKWFSDKSNLIIHVRSHSGEKPYECQICKKKFSGKSSLKCHGCTHTDEKPFECEMCKKKFSRNKYLATHVRRHAGLKPYLCNQCQKCFSKKSDLTRHIRIHTGEKPHQCHLCKKCFSETSHLKIHVRSHTGEKPYQCVLCLKLFSQKGHLNKHVRRLHNIKKPC